MVLRALCMICSQFAQRMNRSYSFRLGKLREFNNSVASRKVDVILGTLGFFLIRGGIPQPVSR